VRALLVAVALMAAWPARAAQWSVTELQWQRGRLKAPKFAGSAQPATNILTIQHASGWGFGDVFLFVDVLDDGRHDGFNDRDAYGELYVDLSLGRMTRHAIAAGPLKDVGILLGVNADSDADVRKWLPGVRLAWKPKGFAFLNTDLTAYLDDSAGVAHGGAPKETASWMLDVNWARPFTIGRASFSIEGHAEWITARRDELGHRVAGWILAQPQFRVDLGKALHGKPDHLFAGVEWQYWRNKLGDRSTDENVPQALLVWRF
jgi:nucleoside-specific outer membrane channel protein Tsx